MERTGASAHETPVPSSLQRYACENLAEVRRLEAEGDLPPPPPLGTSTDTDYLFIERLPTIMAGARAPPGAGLGVRRPGSLCSLNRKISDF